MKKGIRKRITAFTLAVLLMGTSIQLPVMAAGDCEHHTQHTAECGYVEGVEGSACTHEHGDECYSEATVCVHNHDESCGYAEAVEGSACNHSHDESCGEDGVACAHGHDESCGYKEAQEGTICTHVCSSENGCITLEENCIHVDHDENCGYREAVEGTPCAFSCDDCTSEEAVQENENQKDEQREEQKDEEDTDICICEDKCTAETINEECPVCSLEEADLALCIGEEAEDEEETNNCICETDDPAFHATNCPAYVPSENPVCTCAEKCTEDTLNVWCEVCGLQGVEFCEGEEVISTYEEVVSYDIRVGGVGMNDGDYLACDAVSVSDTKPASGGYAYYMDGTLTLNNYTFNGDGFEFVDIHGTECTAVIYSDCESGLTIVLEGDSSLINTNTNTGGYGIYASYENISGTGTLTIDADTGIFAVTDVRITGSNITINDAYDGIYARADVSISDSTVKNTDCWFGIYSGNGVSITNSDVTISGSEEYGICGYTGVIISDSNVTISDVGSNGIGTVDGDVSITDSTVKITAEMFGINVNDDANNDVNISGKDTLVEIEGEKAIALDPEGSFVCASYLAVTDGNGGSADYDDPKIVISWDESYNWPGIYVGGVELANGKYLSQDGSIGTNKPSGGYAYYKDGTLTLNNYTYEGGGYQYEEENEDGDILLSSAAIYYNSDFDLTIVLEGNNSFTNTMGEDAGEGYGIRNNMSDLTITGMGLLTINSGNDGIRGEHDVIIENGTVIIHSGDDGIYTVDYDVEITGGTVEIDADDDGIDSGVDVEITGGTVKIDADDDGIESSCNVKITGGTVEIDASEDGIDSGVDVEITGGTVKIDADYEGIEAGDNVKITGGTVEINAESDGIYAEVDAEISGNSAVEINADDYGIGVYESMKISDNSTVEINADYCGIYAEFDAEIIGGTVIIDAYEYGIFAWKYVEISGNSAVEINADDYGIDVYESMKISDNSAVKINAVGYGIYADQFNVEISGKSTVEIEAGSGIFARYGSIDIDPNLNILLPEGGTKEDFASATQVLITVACEHEYSDSYIYNDTHHWKKCTKNCSSNEYPESFGTNYVEHIVDETTGKCVCGYDSSRIADVYVGGFGLDDGEYLSNGGGIGHEVPSGGYAYYKDGTLTLNNYSYTGKGYSYLDEYSDECFSTLYSNQDLTIQLEGANSLKNIKPYGDGVTAIEADLVFNGNGTLNIQADGGIYTYGKYNEEDAYSGKGGISINGGTLNIKADYYGVWCDGDITVTDGTLTVNSGEEGITSVNGNISVNGGNNDITAKSHGMEAMQGNIYFNGGNTVVSGDVAVNASGGITLGQGITVLEPVGAKVAYVTVSIGDEDGERYVICKDDGKTVATSVKFAAKDNSGGSSNTPPASGDNNNGGSSNTPPASGDNNSGGSSNTPPASDNNSKEDVNPLVTFGNLRGNVGNTTLASDEEDKDSEIPFIKNEEGKQGWDVIRDEVVSSNDGTTLTVDMNGATVVPGDIFNDIKGKDITMVFDLGNGVTWSVNGLSISSDNIEDIDFEVKVGDDANDTIPVEVRNTVTGEKSFVNISLSYEGDFGFTAVLSVNLESGNAGLFANLFYYNEQTREMEFICSDEIAEDGTVELTFTHASEYTMVIDEVAFNAPASSEEGILPEIGVEAEGDNAETDNATDTTDVSDPLVMASKDADSAWWIVLLIAVLAVAGIAGFVIYSKKNKSE